jgi:hypothetical protein
MATCPFCMTPVHDDATVCPGCGARKGYCQSDGQVHDFGRCMLGFVLAIVLVLGLFLINGYMGLFGLVILGLVLVTQGLPSSEPHWFR